MTANPAATTFRVHGELSQQAIAALARLLIDHARRELDEEQRREAQAEHDDHQQQQECQVCQSN